MANAQTPAPIQRVYDRNSSRSHRVIKPAVGSLIVSAWLALIALTLLAGWNYADVAVRDLVMAIGAFSFFTIAKFVQHHGFRHERL